MNYSNPFYFEVLSINRVLFLGGLTSLIGNIVILLLVLAIIYIIIKKPPCGEVLAFGFAQVQFLIAIFIANSWIYGSYCSMSGFARFLMEPGSVSWWVLNCSFMIECGMFHLLLISLCIIATILRYRKTPSLSYWDVMGITAAILCTGVNLMVRCLLCVFN